MIEAWWQSLTLTLQIFWTIGIVATAAIAIQALLLILGFDGDADLELDADGLHDGGGGVLSVRTVTAFFVGFAWTGIAALDAGWGVFAAVLAAFAVGTAFMAGIFFLMRGLYSLRASGNVDYGNAVGVVATVYLPIPPAMSAPGQVEVLVQGRLKVVEAFTRGEETLANRTRVEVTEAIGPTTLVVRRLDNETTGEHP